jgi:hypothetical protein
MPQEAVFLLLQVREALAHPVEPLAELLQVFGSSDVHRRAEIRLPEPPYGRVDLTDRPRDEDREADHQENDDGEKREQLPQRDVLRLTRGRAHVLDFAIDELVAALVDRMRAFAQTHESLNRFLKLFGPSRRTGEKIVDRLFGVHDLAQRVALLGVERKRGEIAGGREELLPVHPIGVQQPAIAEDDHLVRGALHRRDQLGELAAALRRLNRLVNGFLALVAELVDGDRVVDERDHERQRNQREADKQQRGERARVEPHRKWGQSRIRVQPKFDSDPDLPI